MPVGDVRRLELRWAFGISNEIIAYGQPAVFGGRLYFGSQVASVYSLDAETGCQHWVYRAGAGVRTGIVGASIVTEAGAVDALFFGDQRGSVYALAAEDGRELWQVSVDDHPYAQVTGSPVLYEGRLIVPMSSFEEVAAADPGYECCTFQGSLAALDAATGEVIWKASMVDQPPESTSTSKTGGRLLGPSGAAIWATPSVDARRRLVYVVTGDNYTEPATDTSDAILAFDLDTGERRWRYQALAEDLFNVSCIMPDPVNCPKCRGRTSIWARRPCCSS